MKRFVLLALLAAAAARAQEPPARAEAGPATSDLEGLLDQTVVSGASAGQETASDAPATTTVITAEQIQRFGLRSLDEAINFFSLGMTVQDPLHAKEIGARGVLLSGDYGNHVLLVVDGHVMNEPWDGTAYYEQGAGIPIDSIDHIEVIVGPGSVLYGGNSMLGTINVVTRKPADQPGLVLVAEGGLSPQQGHSGKIDLSSLSPGGTYRLGAGWAGDFAVLGQKASLLIHAELYGQNGPSFLYGPQTLNDGAAHDYGPLSQFPGAWGGRAGYSAQVPSIYARLEVGDFALALHAASYLRTVPYESQFSYPTDFNDQHSYERDRWLSLDASWHKQLTQKLGLVARLFGDAYDYTDPNLSSDPSVCGPGVTTCSTSLPANSRWAGLELRGTYDWTSRGTLTTMVGAEGRLRRIWDATIFTDFNTGADLGSAHRPIHEERLAAIYLQQRASPLRFLHLNAGLRLDSDSRAGTTALSPRVAATADLWKGGSAKAIYSTGYRTPSIYDSEFAATTLKPEQVRSFEASLEQRWGRTRILVGAFRSDWDALVQLVQDSAGNALYQNASRIENYGAELAASAVLGPVSFGGTLTLAHSRELSDTGAVPLSVAPQLFGNAYASLALSGGHAISFATSFAGDRIADRGIDGGFAVRPVAKASAELRLTLSGPLARGLEYRAGVDYNTGSSAPYVVGPVQDAGAGPATPTAELAPTVRFTAFAGLRFRFAP